MLNVNSSPEEFVKAFNELHVEIKNIEKKLDVLERGLSSTRKTIKEVFETQDDDIEVEVEK